MGSKHVESTGELCVAGFLGVGAGFYRSYVLAYGWNLFLPPLGIAPISFWWAMAFILVQGCLLATPKKGLDSSIATAAVSLIEAAMAHLFLWVCVP